MRHRGHCLIFGDVLFWADFFTAGSQNTQRDCFPRGARVMSEFFGVRKNEMY